MAETKKTRKAMIKIKPKKYKVGEIVTISFMAIHPMETGMVEDKETKKLKPAHYIEEITFSFEGEPFSTMKVWESVSANPVFSINYQIIKKGKLAVNFKDNLGDEVLLTKKIKPKKS